MSNAAFLRPDENGNWGKVGADAAGNMSEQLVFQDGATAVGDGSVADVSGYTTLSLQVVISGSLTVAFEGSVDGTNWFSVMSSNAISGSGSTQTTTSSTNTLRFNVAGFKYFRARISVYTSGTVTVVGYLTTAPLPPANIVATYGNSDSNVASASLLGVGAYTLLYDPQANTWTRQRSSALPDGSAGSALSANGLYAFNGASWDKVRTVSAGDAIATGLLAQGQYVYDATNTNWNRVVSASATSDGYSGTKTSSVATIGYNGSSFDKVRVGKVYKHTEYLSLPDATGTTVWTPASGKKFRLMGISVSCGSAGRLAIRDGNSGTDFIARFLYAGADTKTFDFGNGYLSLQADRVLELRNNSGATVNAWVTAWGTEE